MPNDLFKVNEVEQTAMKFTSRHIEPLVEDIDHGAPQFQSEIFSRGIEAGFDRFALPEDVGGIGFQMADLCMLIKTIAKTCAGNAMIFGVHAAVLTSICEAGGDKAKSLVDKITSSKKSVAATIPEPLSFNDFDSALTVDNEDQNSVWLSGNAGLLFNVAPGGLFVVFAKTRTGSPLAILLESGEETFKLGSLELALGLRAMPMAELTLIAHEVPRSHVITTGDQTVVFYRALLRNLCLVISAAAGGLMATAHKKALAYAAERYQGGKMIIDHSHLRNILGAMSSNVSASIGAAFHAAAQPKDDLAVIGIKVSVTECAAKTCIDAVQILGGYGYMRDYGLEKSMRDAAMLSLLPISNVSAELLLAAIEKEKIV